MVLMVIMLLLIVKNAMLLAKNVMDLNMFNADIVMQVSTYNLQLSAKQHVQMVIIKIMILEVVYHVLLHVATAV